MTDGGQSGCGWWRVGSRIRREIQLDQVNRILENREKNDLFLD
jgi:hypothetical protein